MFNPGTLGQRQVDLFKFHNNVVYMVSSRTGLMQRGSVSKRRKTQTTAKSNTKTKNRCIQTPGLMQTHIHAQMNMQLHLQNTCISCISVAAKKPP